MLFYFGKFVRNKYKSEVRHLFTTSGRCALMTSKLGQERRLTARCQLNMRTVLIYSPTHQQTERMRLFVSLALINFQARSRQNEKNLIYIWNSEVVMFPTVYGCTEEQSDWQTYKSFRYQQQRCSPSRSICRIQNSAQSALI